MHEDDTEFKDLYLEFLREAGHSDSHTPMSIKRAKKIKDLKSAIPGPLNEFVGV